MSYILDALRRAEADRERERGQVPGLHAQPTSGSKAGPAAGPRRWLPWAGGGLLLLAGIGAGSWWARGTQDAPSPIAAPVAQPAPAPAPVATAAPAAVPVPPAAPSVTAPMPQPAASGSPYLSPAAPPVAVAPAPAPRPVSVPAPAPAPVVAVTPAPAPAAPPPAPAPAPAPAVEAPIPRLAELPEGLRREVPRFVVSGSVYSDDPRGRFAMINGEVMREGAQIGPDHVLEQIRPRELVLRFKGQRYRQPV